jgi:hypothetical protein
MGGVRSIPGVLLDNLVKSADCSKRLDHILLRIRLALDFQPVPPLHPLLDFHPKSFFIVLS